MHRVRVGQEADKGHGDAGPRDGGEDGAERNAGRPEPHAVPAQGLSQPAENGQPASLGEITRTVGVTGDFLPSR